MFRLKTRRLRLRATNFSIRGTWVLLSIFLLNSCGKPLSRNDCEALLQRYVKLLAASDRPETSTSERLHMQEQAKQKAALDPEFAHCSKSVSRAQYDCAMLAPSTDEFERCLM